MDDLLVLIVTYRCNLKCAYCPTIKKNKNMVWDIAKRSLDLFNSLKSNNKEVKFFGGEPLLEFELIKKIVEHGRRLDKKMKYELTTNGILLDKDKIEFFKRNNFELRISIDGSKRIQTSERGAKAWEAFTKLNGRDKEYVIVNIVVSPRWVSKFCENFRFLFENGFRNFNLLPSYFNRWDEKEILILGEELQKVVKFVKEHGEIYIKNKDINKKEYLFNEGIIVDIDGCIYNTNKIMIKQYSNSKNQFKLCNISEIQNFEELNRTTSVSKVNIKEHLTNLKLDRVLSNFVKSL